jgi:hypothetical protein
MGTLYKARAFNISDGTEQYFFFYSIGPLSLIFTLINYGVYNCNWTDTLIYIIF